MHMKQLLPYRFIVIKNLYGEFNSASIATCFNALFNYRQ